MSKIKQYLKNKYGKEITYVRYTLRIVKRRISKLRKKTNYKYPKILQLPITYHCNFDCVMCGMKKQIKKQDFTAAELRQILENGLFCEIESVGVNGGEPFLKNDLVECIEVILEKLSKLKRIDIISNAFCTELILEKLSVIKNLCEKYNVQLGISFSLDGIGDMQDFMRGHKGAYEQFLITYHKIKDNQERYCDVMGIICTITRHNIAKINEVEVWAQRNKANISYNIATIHKRIENEDKFEDFTILNDKKAKMLAQEFFYKKYLETRQERYWGLFLYLRDNKRYSVCDYLCGAGVTLTPNGQIGYCATYSDELGDAMSESAETIFRRNVAYRKNEICHQCDTCSHYMYELSIDGMKQLRQEMVREVIRK